MLQLGKTTALIVDNAIQIINDKEVVALTFETQDGDSIGGVIWLTEKAMGMARRQLKVCGFDVDKDSLATLDADPKHLAGRKVPIEIEEYNGRMKASIVTSQGPGKKRIAELDKALRAVKKDNAPAPLKMDSDDDEDVPF